WTHNLDRTRRDVRLFVQALDILKVLPQLTAIFTDRRTESRAHVTAAYFDPALLGKDTQQMACLLDSTNLNRRLGASQLGRLRTGPGLSVVLRPGLEVPAHPRSHYHEKLTGRY